MKAQVLILCCFSLIFLFSACEQDPCKGVNCLNQAVCIDGLCDCINGYEGDDCSILSREKYLSHGLAANWITKYNEDECFSTGYTMPISPDVENENILISNFAGYGPDAKIKCKTIIDSFFQIEPVSTGNETITDVKGAIVDNTISFSYHVQSLTSDYVCKSKATKN